MKTTSEVRARGGFTLIEMLVVISIIVILVAILVPALSYAIYAAELATCSANQDAVSKSLIIYSQDHKRAYPYRIGIRGGTHSIEEEITETEVVEYPVEPSILGPRKIKAAEVFDDRPMFAAYFSLDLLKDPMQPGGKDIDYGELSDGSDVHVWAGYQIWAGFGYNGFGGMFRYGDKLVWFGQDRHQEKNREMNFDVIVSCDDMFGESEGGSEVDLFLTGHQDKRNRLRELYLQSEAPTNNETFNDFGAVMATTKQTRASWLGKITPVMDENGNVEFGGRGNLDKNIAFTDGSVDRYQDVNIDLNIGLGVPVINGKQENRLQTPPAYKDGNTDGTRSASGGDWFMILPESG